MDALIGAGGFNPNDPSVSPQQVLIAIYNVLLAQQAILQDIRYLGEISTLAMPVNAPSTPYPTS